ncbi:MAG: hypothetical protein HY433_00585 [Candidatus Liptonbacteria bacterium]|nr:hypothetical protein [Candidatus Liptonbacteria bacterium]
MKTLLLIDANSIIHRCFHAMPPLTSADGRPIQAIYGLTNILLKITREENPEYVAACFDRPEPTFRKKEYSEYKAQRPPTPDGLISQIIEAQTLFRKFGIRVFEKPGFEADDLIATLAEKFGDESDTNVVILTGDLDTLQMVRGKKIVVRAFKKGISETTIYDEQAVLERYGLKPKEMSDYKALVGDTSDNIKGAPGIGPKTAGELVKRFGTIEGMFDNLDKLPEKVREKFQKAETEIKLSKKLVELETKLDVGISGIEELKRIEDRDALKEYFRELGFGTFLKRLENGSGANAKKQSRQGKIFS